MKNISILGSTGSIGVQTLQVLRINKDKFKLYSITGHNNIDLLEQQIREFRPVFVVLSNEDNYSDLKNRIGNMAEIEIGQSGLINAATLPEVDTVVTSIVGAAGLVPTYNAICHGKNIALANKETLVTAGRIIMNKAKEKGVSILPVDSEHSAIFQSIADNKHEAIKKLILTASGGPFRGKKIDQLQNVSIMDTLNHPRWKMGKKITTDSATLMNKGLEIIEARWLFDINAENIDVCVHPQSIIHSMVEFIDGSVLAQLGVPDMKLPIQYALTYPERVIMNEKKLDLTEIGSLTFEKPDMETFKCLKLAYQALEAGDSACVVLNGANEEAVSLFLQGKIRFIDIANIIESVISIHSTIEISSIDDVVQLDNWARIKTKEQYEKRCFV